MAKKKKTILEKFAATGYELSSFTMEEVKEIIMGYVYKVAELETQIAEVKKSKVVKTKEVVEMKVNPITLKQEDYDKLLTLIKPKTKRNRK